MSTHNLGTLWTAIGFILFSTALATWVNAQGSYRIAEVILIDARPTVAELFALFICSTLLALEAEIGIRYARKAAAATWHERMPVVLTRVLSLRDPETGSLEGKWYQRFWLFAFIVLPAVALLRFVVVVLDSGVSDTRDLTPMTPLSGIPLGRFIDGPYLDDAFRIGPTAAATREDLAQMVTWFPVIEPVVIALLVVFSLVQSIRLGFAVCRAPGSADTPASGRSDATCP